eukprot:m.32006 g.32006  ORF g.32006 m.32006 type:complete len:128 (+) comp6997_c0_seq2:318-701(+)
MLRERHSGSVLHHWMSTQEIEHVGSDGLCLPLDSHKINRSFVGHDGAATDSEKTRGGRALQRFRIDINHAVVSGSSLDLKRGHKFRSVRIRIHPHPIGCESLSKIACEDRSESKVSLRVTLASRFRN